MNRNPLPKIASFGALFVGAFHLSGPYVDNIAAAAPLITGTGLTLLGVAVACDHRMHHVGSRGRSRAQVRASSAATRRALRPVAPHPADVDAARWAAMHDLAQLRAAAARAEADQAATSSPAAEVVIEATVTDLPQQPAFAPRAAVRPADASVGAL